MIWFWFAVFIVAAIIEVCTTTMVSVWFCCGSVVSMVLAAFNAPVYLQILFFFFISIVCILLFLFVFRKKKKNNEDVKTNLDSLIGSFAMVEEEIEEMGKGRVKINSMSWLAEEENKKGVQVGEWVRVVKISGVTLVVSKDDKKKSC